MEITDPNAVEKFAASLPTKDKTPVGLAGGDDLDDVEASAASGWAGGIGGTVGGASYLFSTSTVGDPMPMGNNPVIINEYTAMTCPSLWRGTQFIAQTLAGIPKHIMQKIVTIGASGQTARKQRDHEDYRDYILNDEANDLQTALQFWECICHHAVVWGNGYALIVREDDGVTIKAVYLLPPDRVIPFRWAGKQWYALQMIYDYTKPTQQWRAISADNVLHIPGFGFDGMRGYPVVQMMARNLRLGVSAEVYGEKYFSSGGNIGLVIETDMTLTPEQRIDLQHQIASKHTGLDAAHLAMILQKGLKAKNLTMPQETAQYLATRTFALMDVARILGVEPFILYEYGRATWSNLSAMQITSVQSSLMPWINRIEAETKRKLFTWDEKRVLRLGVEFDINQLTRGDTTQQAADSNMRLLSGKYNVNEERARDGQPGIGPQGDVYRVPVQLQTPEVKPPVISDPPPDGGKFTVDLTPLLDDVSARVGAKTIKATESAIKKHHGNPSQFTAWSNGFADEQAQYADQCIRPLLLTFSRMCPEMSLAEADVVGQRYAAAIREYHSKLMGNVDAVAPNIKEMIYVKANIK